MIFGVTRLGSESEKIVRYMIPGDWREELERVRLSGKDWIFIVRNCGIARVRDMLNSSVRLSAGGNTVIECPRSAVV